MNRYFAAVVCLGLVVISASGSQANENEWSFQDDSRAWRDASGNHEMQAALVKYQDRQLTLRAASGKTIVVSLDNLSKADQSYVVTRLRMARRDARQSVEPIGDEATPKRDTRKNASEVDQAASARQPVDRAIQDAGQQAPERKVQPVQRVRIRPIRPTRLFGIDWYSAEDASRLATADRKPVMWFRVLGDLTGFM